MEDLILEGKLEVLKNLLRKGFITPTQFSKAVVKLKGSAVAVKNVTINKALKYQPAVMGAIDPTIAATIQNVGRYIS